MGKFAFFALALIRTVSARATDVPCRLSSRICWQFERTKFKDENAVSKSIADWLRPKLHTNVVTRDRQKGLEHAPSHRQEGSRRTRPATWSNNITRELTGRTLQGVEIDCWAPFQLILSNSIYRVTPANTSYNIWIWSYFPKDVKIEAFPNCIRTWDLSYTKSKT